MYADTITGSMQRAIDETNRRREIQEAYNIEHGITPQSIKKKVKELIELTKVAETPASYKADRISSMTRTELLELASTVEKEMRQAAKNLEFERAADLRDMLAELRQRIADTKPDSKEKGKAKRKR